MADKDPFAQYAVSAPPSNTAFGQPRFPSIGEIGANLLPHFGGTVGGIVGGTAGIPAGPPGIIGGAVAGAGLGGAGGEAMRQLWRHAMNAADPSANLAVPQTPLDAFVGISRATTEQGASELAGRGLAAGAERLALPLMRYGIRASASATRKAAKVAGEPEPDFNRMARVALEERAPTSARVRARLAEVEREVGGRVSESVARGEKFSIAEAATPLIEQAEKSLGRPLTRLERSEIVRRARDAANEALAEIRSLPPGRQIAFNAAEGRQMKKVFQDRSRGTYAGVATGGRRPPNKSEDVALGQGMRRAVNRLAGTIAPDTRAQGLIHLDNALSAQEAGIHPTALQYLLGAGAAGSHVMSGRALEAVPVGLGMAALGSPTSMRWTANLMTDPFVQYLLSQTPRSAAFGLEQLTQEPDGE